MVRLCNSGLQIQPAIRSELHARVRASNEGLARKPSGEEGYNLRTLLRKDGEFQVAMTATPVPKSTPGFRGAKKLRRSGRAPCFENVLARILEAADFRVVTSASSIDDAVLGTKAKYQHPR
jgi:hypothetical protein